MSEKTLKVAGWIVFVVIVILVIIGFSTGEPSGGVVDPRYGTSRP